MVRNVVFGFVCAAFSLICSAVLVPHRSPAQELHSQGAQNAQSKVPLAGPPQDPQNEVQALIRVHSDLVVLSVTVKNRTGNLVVDLSEGDFRIFDDGVEQSIDAFTAEGLPLSLVVLVDDDLKSADAAQMAPTLRAILAGLSASDEVMVCRFDILFYPGRKFTRDEDELIADLRDAREHSKPSQAGPVPWVTPPSTHPMGVGEVPPAASVNMGGQPTKALHDAIFASAELLKARGSDRRKIILVISDGLNGERFNHHKQEEVRKTLLLENISLYSIAVGSDGTKKQFARLEQYARNSGGDVYYAAKGNTMESLYSRITEQARHEYALAYVPRGNNQLSAFHRIQVQTTKPGMNVQTRDGYFRVATDKQ